MVEVGSVRIKNTKSILVKNLLDACVGSVMFFLYGWAFSFGKGNAFVGTWGSRVELKVLSPFCKLTVITIYNED